MAYKAAKWEDDEEKGNPINFWLAAYQATYILLLIGFHFFSVSSAVLHTFQKQIFTIENQYEKSPNDRLYRLKSKVKPIFLPFWTI